MHIDNIKKFLHDRVILLICHDMPHLLVDWPNKTVTNKLIQVCKHGY